LKKQEVEDDENIMKKPRSGLKPSGVFVVAAN
jgi:hypothetical protein